MDADKQKITESKPSDIAIHSDCITCDRNTNHKILNCWNVHDSFNWGDIQTSTDFQIIQCQGCNSLSFRTNFSHSEDTWFDDATGESGYIYTTTLYPNRAVGKLRISPMDLLLIPPIVSQILNETHDAICMKNDILSVVGIRTTLEAVCQEQGCKGNLKGKINSLIEKDFITQKNAEILQKLRLLGNESVHEMKRHTKNDIDIAFAIVQNLLESVYIIPKKAETIK